MNTVFLRWPGFRMKALTLSYDDGVYQDRRLVEIMNKNGIRGTFNLNGSVYVDPSKNRINRMSLEEIGDLYKGHEIATHGYTHPFFSHMPAGNAAYDIVRDREMLEQRFGGIIRGHAYPMGDVDNATVQTLKDCGIVYGRMVPCSFNFELPRDFMRWYGTCRNIDGNLMQLADSFLTYERDWTPKLFYLWGHSYEFDDNNGWETIEKFCEKMGGHEDIWYATNIEIYDYLTAFSRLEASVDGKTIHNPTAVTLYLRDYHAGKDVTLAPGETAKFCTEYLV